MTSDSYNRRRTDRGYAPQGRSTLQVLRSVLGLVPVTESLSDLSHWRRRAAASPQGTAAR